MKGAGKMRARFETILAAAVALCVGVAAGWFAAARAWGNCGNVETANVGRARSSSAPTEKAKPRRKALIRSSADAEVQKRILENKISYLEKCIAAAKVSDAKPAEKMRETNAELVERLMKLPTENERWTAYLRLDKKTQMALTLGEMKRLCPKHTVEALATAREREKALDRMTELTARRIGILWSLDRSSLTEEESAIHSDFMENVAGIPGLYADFMDQRDTMTIGEIMGRSQKFISCAKRCDELRDKERAMLVSLASRCFEVPEADAEELQLAIAEAFDFTNPLYFSNYKD